MARWRLTEPHYLRVEGTKWEYTEIDRVTGRPKRTQFDVPQHIDPNSPDDLKVYGQPDGQDTIVIVSDGDNAQPKDVIFQGDPTPGMFPLDDAARAISARFEWQPTQGLDDISQNESFQNKLLSGFIDKMTEMKSGSGSAGFEQLMSSIMAMMEKQTEILAKLAQPERRKVA